MTDNTDERGEDYVARSRGGSEPPTARDTIASLRKGDEVEADFDSDRGPYMIRGAVFGNPKYVGPKWLHHATAVRVIKRAPLPEPPCPFPMGAKVRVIGTLDEYEVVSYGWVGCRGRMEVRARAAGRNAWFSRPPEELELVTAPEPLTCAVCGEPVGRSRVYPDSVLHVTLPEPGDHHAATLTSPEPPAGTPVWWDGKWWIRDEESAPYAPTLWAERDTVKFWKFMPGAVVAATPEEAS